MSKKIRIISVLVVIMVTFSFSSNALANNINIENAILDNQNTILPNNFIGIDSTNYSIDD